MLRSLLATTVVLLASATLARAQDPTPTVPPKCSAVPPANFPAQPPAADTRQGRFAACLLAKDCKDGDEKTTAGIAASFCQMNHYGACRGATCDKPTLVCMAEFRSKGSKGLKVSKCVSQPSKIACPKEGEAICLCDLELEAKGSIQCGSVCQIAPTPTPQPR